MMVQLYPPFTVHRICWELSELTTMSASTLSSPVVWHSICTESLLSCLPPLPAIQHQGKEGGVSSSGRNTQHCFNRAQRLPTTAHLFLSPEAESGEGVGGGLELELGQDAKLLKSRDSRQTLSWKSQRAHSTCCAEVMVSSEKMFTDSEGLKPQTLELYVIYIMSSLHCACTTQLKWA